MARQAAAWQRDGLKSFGGIELPEHVTTRTGHSAWLALVDQQNAAGLRLFDDESEAHTAHHAGVHRLLLIALSDKLKYVAKKHRLSPPTALAWTRAGDVAALESALASRVVDDLIEDAWGIRDAEAFSALEARIRPVFVEKYQRSLEI